MCIITTILAAIVSGLSIYNTEIYHDNDFVKSAWLANDWITLVVVVPSLIVGLLVSKNGGFKSNLIVLGLKGYLFYTYAFYLFGATFNSVFLLYVAIYSLSFFALILGLASMSELNSIGTSKSLKLISVFLILISIMLCLVEIPPCFNFISNGKIPEIVLKSQIHTSIVYALDLSFIVPTMIISSILLWQNKTWGIILSAIMLVKCFTYGLVLTLGTILLINKGLDNDSLLPIWIFITVGGLAGIVVLLKNVKIVPFTSII